MRKAILAVAILATSLFASEANAYKLYGGYYDSQILYNPYYYSAPYWGGYGGCYRGSYAPRGRVYDYPRSRTGYITTWGDDGPTMSTINVWEW